jgi:hypothetical protein
MILSAYHMVEKSQDYGREGNKCMCWARIPSGVNGNVALRRQYLFGKPCWVECWPLNLTRHQSPSFRKFYLDMDEPARRQRCGRYMGVCVGIIKIVVLDAKSI